MGVSVYVLSAGLLRVLPDSIPAWPSTGKVFPKSAAIQSAPTAAESAAESGNLQQPAAETMTAAAAFTKSAALHTANSCIPQSLVEW